MTSTRQFLIVFNHDTQFLEHEIAIYDDVREATETYAAFERRYADQHHLEVVLLGSDSIETVRETHPNYFEKTADFDDLVDELLAGHA